MVLERIIIHFGFVFFKLFIPSDSMITALALKHQNKTKSLPASPMFKIRSIRGWFGLAID